MTPNLKIAESTGHGKAVRGTKKTSTIQVRNYGQWGDGSYLLEKEFRFTVGDEESRAKAVEKAEEYVNDKVKAQQ